MKRYDIINHLIKLYGYKSYLEIGIDKGENFGNIIIEDKDGVDPAGNCRFVMTSDKFFETNKKMYDIVFIDGLHTADQVLRDVENSLKYLNDGGTILLHDCCPKRKKHQLEKRAPGGSWNGNVWVAFAKLRIFRSDLYMKCVDTNYGIGIIRRGSQKTLNLDPKQLGYNLFKKRRKEILNLISVEEFFKEFK